MRCTAHYSIARRDQLEAALAEIALSSFAPTPLLRRRLPRAAPASRCRPTRHLPSAVVAEIRLLSAPSGVGVGQPKPCAFVLTDLLPAVVADEHCLSRHGRPPSGNGSESLTKSVLTAVGLVPESLYDRTR
jgi:hypothetical protein